MKGFVKVLLLIVIILILIFLLLWGTAYLAGFSSIGAMWSHMKEQLDVMWERLWNK